MFGFFKKNAALEDAFVELTEEQLSVVSGGHHAKHHTKKHHKHHKKHHGTNHNNHTAHNNAMTTSTPMRMHF